MATHGAPGGPTSSALYDAATDSFRRWRAGEEPALDDLVRTMSPVLWHVVRATGLESPPSALVNLLPVSWVVGTAVAIFLLAAAAFNLARLALAAQPVSDPRLNQLAADVARTLNVKRPIRLLQCAGGIIPMTWGIRRPRVMLPASAAGWSDDRTRAVLAHELAHVRRGDWFVHMLAELCCAIYWFAKEPSSPGTGGRAALRR